MHPRIGRRIDHILDKIEKMVDELWEEQPGTPENILIKRASRRVHRSARSARYYKWLEISRRKKKYRSRSLNVSRIPRRKKYGKHLTLPYPRYTRL